MWTPLGRAQITSFLPTEFTVLSKIHSELTPKVKLKMYAQLRACKRSFRSGDGKLNQKLIIRTALLHTHRLEILLLRYLGFS